MSTAKKFPGVSEKFSQADEEGAKLKALDENFAIIEFEPDGTILKANENFLKTVGYSEEEVVGNHHKIFCPRKS